MTFLTIFQRVQGLLPAYIRQNTLSDALLGGASDELAYLDAKTEAWHWGADDVQPGYINVAIGGPSVTVSLYTYTDGTVTTNATRRVVGTGTRWLSQVSPGDVFTVTGESAGVVFQVVDDVTIDLVSPLVNTASGLTYVTKAPVDFTTIFAVGDELAIAGSVKGFSGRYPITTVSSASLVITATFGDTETRLWYGTTKPRLLIQARGLSLFPGGYETSAQLRTLLASAVTTHQQRGTTNGLVADLTQLSNFAATLTDSIKPGAQLQAGVATTANGAAMTVAGWASGLTQGKSFTVVGSALHGNGRYWVYSNSGTVLTPARRPVHSYEYFSTQTSGIELQFREDRVNQRVYFRVNNPSGVASKTIAMSLTVNGVGSVTAAVPTGAGYSVGVAGNVASFSWTLATNEPFREGWVNVGSLSSSIEFAPVVSESSTGTAMQIIRLGNGGLNSRNADGTINLTCTTWKWGGLVKTAFRSETAETGLTVYNGAFHGLYLNAGYPGNLQNDAYTVASPSDFLVAEVDNRNATNISNTDIKNIARDNLVPVDADYIIEFV